MHAESQSAPHLSECASGSCAALHVVSGDASLCGDAARPVPRTLVRRLARTFETIITPESNHTTCEVCRQVFSRLASMCSQPV